MIEIIPAIDLIEGKCVRLSGGDFAAKTVYAASPLEAARTFEAAGFRRLHLVDLDGARSGKVTNWGVLEEICSHTRLQVDFSGGISSREDVQRALDAGATYISIGSLAVKAPATFLEWMAGFGTDVFILGADVKDEEVVVKGWTERSGRNIFGFLDEYHAAGIQRVFCTDVSKDGMLAGPAVDLYTRILERFPGLHLIASGGVRSLADIEQLQAAGCQGVIMGKAFYEGRIKPEDLKDYVD